jgi:PII-like signaling protein
LERQTRKLMKIYTGENEHWQGTVLYHALALKLRELGLAGVTVYRGMEGYGPEKRLRTSRILELSADLPVILEVVDTAENIERALPLVREMVKKGIIIIQDVEIIQDGEAADR